ncbi:MAG: cobalamin-binding protein [Sphingobacteriales bacterium]|nr:MAG: cobalamin-binding protein [Sphingobacteriales bacterium]
MRLFTDMMGRTMNVPDNPQRIISVVPSQTELLFDLGLNDEVVGITKFCIHPEDWFRNKTRIGGTKKLRVEEIIKLNPDLIIANKEENEQEQIEELAKHFPVWVSDIHNIPQALQMIQVVGQLTNRETKANDMVEEMVQGFNTLTKAAKQKRVAYMIWYNPWMSVGTDTFISNMIQTMGWKNVLQDKSRYPEVTMDELKAYEPELVLLSSEPFPFKEQHIEEVKQALPNAEVMLVDGEMFSWYGSRMLKAVNYLDGLIQRLG